MPRFEPGAIAERARQLKRFAEWERDQAPAAAGPRTGEELRRALDWYSDALDFARNVRAGGNQASEAHLEDLVEWVRRWHAAWRDASRAA
jgi:hypothetical protein